MTTLPVDYLPDHNALVQQIGAAFNAAPQGWTSAELVFTKVGKVGEFEARHRPGPRQP